MAREQGVTCAREQARDCLRTIPPYPHCTSTHGMCIIQFLRGPHSFAQMLRRLSTASLDVWMCILDDRGGSGAVQATLILTQASMQRDLAQLRVHVGWGFQHHSKGLETPLSVSIGMSLCMVLLQQ